MEPRGLSASVSPPVRSRDHSGGNETDFRISLTGVNDDNAHYPYVQQGIRRQCD